MKPPSKLAPSRHLSLVLPVLVAFHTFTDRGAVHSGERARLSGPRTTTLRTPSSCRATPAASPVRRPRQPCNSVSRTRSAAEPPCGTGGRLRRAAGRPADVCGQQPRYGGRGLLGLVAERPDADRGSDDACGLQSRVSWEAVAGTVYRISVDGFYGEQGNFTPTWNRNPPPPGLDGRSRHHRVAHRPVDPDRLRRRLVRRRADQPHVRVGSLRRVPELRTHRRGRRANLLAHERRHRPADLPPRDGHQRGRIDQCGVGADLDCGRTCSCGYRRAHRQRHDGGRRCPARNAGDVGRNAADLAHLPVAAQTLRHVLRSGGADRHITSPDRGSRRASIWVAVTASNVAGFRHGDIRADGGRPESRTASSRMSNARPPQRPRPRFAVRTA